MSPHAPPRAILRVLSDERLARHAAGGSQQAFATLCDRHARELLAACRAIVRDEDDARDALQSTMLNAWRAIGRRSDTPVRPWLFRIARNEAITVLRRRRPAAELHEEATTRPDLHEEAAGRAELAEVLAGLEDLTERQREALVLRTLGDAGYDEIARRQATSPQAVRQSVAHARRTLRRRRVAGLIPIPAWLADLATAAGTGGAPAVQAGVAKTAVGVTAAVAVIGGAVGPVGTPRRDAPERATAEARASPGGERSGARAAAAPAAVASQSAMPARSGGDTTPTRSVRTDRTPRTRVNEASSTSPTDAADDPPRHGQRVADPVTPRRRGGERDHTRRFTGDRRSDDGAEPPRERSWPDRRGSRSGHDGHTTWPRTGRDGGGRSDGGDRGTRSPDPSPDVSADRDGPPPSQPDVATGAQADPEPPLRAPTGPGGPPAH